MKERKGWSENGCWWGREEEDILSVPGDPASHASIHNSLKMGSLRTGWWTAAAPAVYGEKRRAWGEGKEYRKERAGV